MRPTSASFVLGLLVGACVGLPLLLVGGYLWQAGLDLRSPSSSREWLHLCARGREAIYCQAADRVVRREVSGPVVFLHPNAGDRDLMAALTVWKGRLPTAQELESVARANLFAASELRTGQMRSLDGQVRWVTCPAPDQRGACLIGPLRVSRHTQPRTPGDGAVYSAFGPGAERLFLQPP